MRYTAWALVGMLALSGCASSAVRDHGAFMELKGEPGSHERKLSAVRKLMFERNGLTLTDEQAEQLVYLFDMRRSGKMTEAEARAYLGADEPIPYPPAGLSPFHFYTFPNGQQMTCQQLGMMTNCY